MKPMTHLALGGLAAGALLPALGPEQSLAFWGASVLIDVDHTWHYVEHTGWRDWSLYRMVAFHYQIHPLVYRPDVLVLNTFHTAEYFLLVCLLAVQLNSSLILAVLWGSLFHALLDDLSLVWLGVPFVRAHSIVEYVIRRRRMLARGVDCRRVLGESARRMALGLPALSPEMLPRHSAPQPEPWVRKSTRGVGAAEDRVAEPAC